MTKDELYQQYVVNNLSRKECATFFNVSEHIIKRRVKEYGFFKTSEQKSSISSRLQKVQIDKDTLYDLYIVQNLSLLECAKKLNLSSTIVKRRLQDFGIKKTGEKFKEIHRRCANPTEESKKKREETVLAKYGVTNVSRSKEVQKKKEKTTHKHYGVANPFQSKEIKDKISEQVMEKYGVPYHCMAEDCRKYSGSNSKPNLNFAKKLDDLGITYTREFVLDKFQYDFKIGNVLVEIDPSIFHNSTFAPIGPAKSESYHAEKTKIAKDYNYHCLHVFDWDDPDKIIQTFFVPKQTIYARNTEVRIVSTKDTKSFVNTYHLQGYAKSEINIGLYEKGSNSPIQIMTFGKPRYNKHYEYELIRLCSSKNVIGGAQKLLNYFVKQYNPTSIVSYCDLSKFDGTIYKKLGFKAQNKPSPSKHWVNLFTDEHITDNLLRQRGFDQLFHTHFGKGTSNQELMYQAGFVEVYDVGQVTYIYKHN